MFRGLRKKRYIWEFDLREKLRDMRAFSTGKHKDIVSETAGFSQYPEDRKRVAIVAIYPSDAAFFSIINLLVAFRNSGFWTLVVSTKKIDEPQRSLLLKHCNHCIERYPVGRDFGSYQVGLRWLDANAMLPNAGYLALANDSMFYTSSFSNQLHEFLSADKQWYALFENFEIHYHVGGFFHVFRKDVFTSQSFQNFWANYKPYSSRKHAIHCGEGGLTKALTAGGFHASVLYSTDRVCDDVFKQLSAGRCDPDVSFALRQSIGDSFFAIVANAKKAYLNGHADSQPDYAEYHTSLAADLVHCLANRIENRNPTHSIGLLCNVLYEAPIKRDIAYRRAIHLGTLLTHCRGFDADEKTCISDDLKTKGLPQSMSFSRREIALYNKARI